MKIKRRRLKKPRITAKRLRELLDYDLKTNLFRWRVDRHGRPKGSIASANRTVMTVDGRQYWKASLAYLHTHGEWTRPKQSKPKPWEAAGMIQQTWYATKRRAAQEKPVKAPSQRKLAVRLKEDAARLRKLGVPQENIDRYLRGWEKISEFRRAKRMPWLAQGVSEDTWRRQARSA